MPKIFNDNDRDIIRGNLMKLGLDALESGGYKNASVEDIARQAGIAKGTFYNFFESKEQFYFEIMLSIRDGNRKALYDLSADSKSIDREGLANFLYERYAKQKNLNHYFTPDEFRIIFRKMPGRLSMVREDSAALATEVLSRLPNVNTDVNSEVVINVINMMGSCAASKEPMSASVREATLRLLSGALAAYILKEADPA